MLSRWGRWSFAVAAVIVIALGCSPSVGGREDSLSRSPVSLWDVIQRTAKQEERRVNTATPTEAGETSVARPTVDQRVQNLEEQLGQVKEYAQALERQISETQSLLSTLHRDVSELEELYALTQPMQQAAADQGRGAGGGAVTEPLPGDVAEAMQLSFTSDPADPDGRLSAKALYDRAFAHLRAQHYVAAMTDFQKVLQFHGKSPLADNTQYWIGEIYYDGRNYERALTEFQRVLSDYPRGNKRADAQLKIGLCYLKFGDSYLALQEFKKVVADFPKSEAAALARKKIAEIQQTTAPGG